MHCRDEDWLYTDGLDGPQVALLRLSSSSLCCIGFLVRCVNLKSSPPSVQYPLKNLLCGVVGDNQGVVAVS